MKKADMIKHLQVKEKTLWNKLRQSENSLGNDSKVTIRDRTRWWLMSELLEELDIESII